MKYFSDLKALYNSDLTSNGDIILFNNKEILIGQKPFFNKEWFAKGIRTINDILDNDGKFLCFESFQKKFGLTRTNFLQFYQVIHAIPKNLVSKLLATKLCSNSSELGSNSTLFDLEPEVKLNLTTMRSREFYSFFVNKSYAEEQTDVKRWNKIVTMDEESWQLAFTSVRTTSKDMKLKEFHFKFLHRMTVTKKELFRFGLKADCECLYSPGILSSKVGQPATNCKRIYLNGFWPRNMSSVTYQKSPKIRAGDVDKKQFFLEPYTAQHGNEAVCTVCCVARV